MKAARILRFGPPSVITNDDVPQPEPAAGQLLVRVKAAGVGNWDALIREGKVQLQPLPLILEVPSYQELSKASDRPRPGGALRECR
jgi:NADPH:quinone reductase-like Zn-dependent oxidoreductase